MTDTTAGTGTPTTDAGEPKTTDSTVTQNTDTSTTPAEGTTQQTADTKPAEPQVPESYEFKMPEGVELDKAAADEFSVIAKELKLDQSTAQKVADIGAKMAQRSAEKQAELVNSWVESVKTDKEIGGDKLEENLATARKALEKFGDPELRDVLNATGFGNHPGLIKLLYRAGKAISEDGFVTGGARTADTDPAKRMFPGLN